jgi:hypothetical protein
LATALGEPDGSTSSCPACRRALNASAAPGALGEAHRGSGVLPAAAPAALAPGVAQPPVGVAAGGAIGLLGSTRLSLPQPPCGVLAMEARAGDSRPALICGEARPAGQRNAQCVTQLASSQLDVDTRLGMQPPARLVDAVATPGLAEAVLTSTLRWGLLAAAVKGAAARNAGTPTTGPPGLSSNRLCCWGGSGNVSGRNGLAPAAAAAAGTPCRS